MNDQPPSPVIQSLAWGVIKVEGLGQSADVKLWPGGGRSWDWTETNTHHVPGIQVADIVELTDHGTEIIVLSRGIQLVLQTCPESICWLNDNHLTHYVLETREAAKIYNDLAAQGVAVGGLFHSTC